MRTCVEACTVFLVEHDFLSQFKFTLLIVNLVDLEHGANDRGVKTLLTIEDHRVDILSVGAERRLTEPAISQAFVLTILSVQGCPCQAYSILLVCGEGLLLGLVEDGRHCALVDHDERSILCLLKSR